MSVAILRPLAIGTYDEWTLGAGATKMAAVDTGDPVNHDDGTSYITTSSNGKTESFTLTGIPAGIAVVNTVSLGWRGRVGTVSGSPYSVSRLYLGGSSVDGTAHLHVDTAWHTVGPSSCARPGGGSWAAGDLTTLQMGVYSILGATVPLQCTSLWIELDYTPSGTCFLPLLSVLLPLIGSMVAFRDMASLSRELYRRTRSRLGPDEFAPALASLREYRWPRYVFLTQPAML